MMLNAHLIAQSKMLVFVSLSSFDWAQRLCLALEGDGDGNGALKAWEGAPALQQTCTQEEFDAIALNRTHDDYFRLAATLPGSNPGPCCLRAVNCGQTLATMGRYVDLLPNTFSRQVSVLSALGGPGGSTPLAVNTVYSLTAIPPSPYDFVLNSGVAVGDQVDFTTENIGGAAEFNIRGPGNVLLKVYELAPGDLVRYFTAVWNGTAWEVKQS